MPQGHFRLITLGRLALSAPDGVEDASLATRRRKLALLAVLALTKRPLPRDVLVEMFWGDQEEGRARHSLSDALSHLRRVLGREAISTRSTEIVLTENAQLAIDTVELAGAMAAKDHARVVSLYGGTFLDGVYAADSVTFEHWVTRERSRFQTMFLEACAKQCLTLARSGAWDDCESLASRWLDQAPTSADAALYLLNALKAPGTRDAGLRTLAEYERLRTRLRRDYGQEPAAPVVALADRLAGEVSAGADEVAAAVAALAKSDAAAKTAATGGNPRSPAAPQTGLTSTATGTSTPAATDTSTATAATPTANPVYIVPATTEEWRALRPRVEVAARVASRRRRSRLTVATLVAVLAVGAAVIANGRVHRASLAEGGTADGRPSIAIMSIRGAATDSISTWLEEGLTQMLAAKLSRTTAVEVVAPERVRQLLVRAQLDSAAPPAIEHLADLGRRIGATWIVSGTVSQGDSTLALDLNVREAKTGRPVDLRVVQGRDVLSLADAAAARLLNAAGLAAPGPRLADVETASVEAYESYTRAVLAGYAGRSAEAQRELDAAIVRDSAFVSALRARLRLAQGAQDTTVTRRLTPLLERYRSRLPEYERLEQEVLDAQSGGEHERSEALGRAFVARYPRDPRTYSLLAGIYQSHGRWDDAEQTLRAELALDSLALEAGRGACAPCGAYSGLFNLQWAKGDLAGGERSARRFVSLQPDSPAAWSTLTSALLYALKYDEALAAGRRMMVLSGTVDAAEHELVARIFIAKRDFARADSVIRALTASPSALLRQAAADLSMQLDRERGHFRASIAVADSAAAAVPSLAFLHLVEGNSLGHVGEYAAAARIYEDASHPAVPGQLPNDLPREPVHTRAFVWHHTLLADAIAPGGDTVRLKAIADTLDMVSRRSYYGRDWKMAHHVRGLVAMRGHRYEEAVREFQAALWSPVGFTRTNAEMARAYLALGRPADAVRMLRFAYSAPLDAMGRYLTRTEIDYLLAIAFAQAGLPDSSAAHSGRVQLAWRDSDPEVRARLDTLVALTRIRRDSTVSSRTR